MSDYNNDYQSGNGPFVVKPENHFKTILGWLVVGVPAAVGLVFFLLGMLITDEIIHIIIGAILLFGTLIIFLIVSKILRTGALKAVEKDPNAKTFEGVITAVGITSRSETMGKVTVRSRYTISIKDYPTVTTSAFGTEQFQQGTSVTVKVNPKKPKYAIITGVSFNTNNTSGFETYNG